MKRRQLLAVCAAGACALAGCQRSVESPLPDDAETVLGAVPEAVGNRPLNGLTLYTTDPGSGDDEEESPGTIAIPTPGATGDGPEETGAPVRTFEQIEKQVGVGAEAIDRLGIATYAQSKTRLEVIAGSFEADAIAFSRPAATHAADGLAVAADQNRRPWDRGLDAALSAVEDREAGVTDSVEPTLDALEDGQMVQVYPEPDRILDGPAVGSARTAGVSRRTLAGDRLELRYAVTFDNSAAASEPTVERLIAADGQSGREPDVTVERDGRTLIASVTRPVPRYWLPDNSPAARFVLDPGGVLEQVGEEPVDPARLEFRVDGETHTPPWDDRETPIEPGERFEIGVDPFRVVEVVWLDPELDVEQPLGRDITRARLPFTDRYELSERTFAITYRGDEPVDAGPFTVRRTRTGGGETEQPLSAYVGATLTPGAQVRLPGAEYGDSVAIEYSIQRGSTGFGGDVFRERVEPPGAFRIRPSGGSGGTVTVTYRGPAQPAAGYRIRLGPVPAPVQFTDRYDRLTDGDGVTFDRSGAARIVVEWVGDGDSLVLAEWTDG